MATEVESYPNLIGGEWKVSTSSTLENHNPGAYREVVGLFPLATALVHHLGRLSISSNRSNHPAWLSRAKPCRVSPVDT